MSSQSIAFVRSGNVGGRRQGTRAVNVSTPARGLESPRIQICGNAESVFGGPKTPAEDSLPRARNHSEGIYL